MMKRRKSLKPVITTIAQIQRERTIEVKRSLSLFSAITRILILMAVLCLLFLNEAVAHRLLEVTSEPATTTNEAVIAITAILTRILAILLVVLIVTSILGLWAFASLNRYLLTCYGWMSISEVLFISFILIMTYSRPRINEQKVALFKNYKISTNARSLVNIIQNKQQCCGSKEYMYEDLQTLPNSCCPADSPGRFACTKKDSFATPCDTSRKTFRDAIEYSHLEAFLPYLVVLVFVNSVTAATFAFQMVQLLSVEDPEEYDFE